MAARPGDYTHFKSIVPLKRVSVGSKQFRYYDSGPKSAPPLVCLPGTAGTADVFYKQMLSLSMKGYRVIAADAPPVWSHQEWVNVFEKFLDTIGVHHIHIYGTSLGGFLAQLFAHYRPRRVKSLVLSNTFLDTREFAAATTWASLINYTPEFMLKRYILSGIRDGPHEPLIADSIDFVVSQLETLSKSELASRLTLNTAVCAIGQILVPDSAITIMDTNDYCAVPQGLRDEVGVRYPGARKAVLKSGGDFPFLSRADEVNLHLQLHMRRVGVEGMVVIQGPVSKDSSGEGGLNSPEHNGGGMPYSGRGGGPGEGSSPSSSSSSTYDVSGQQVMQCLPPSSYHYSSLLHYAKASTHSTKASTHSTNAIMAPANLVSLFCQQWCLFMQSGALLSLQNTLSQPQAVFLTPLYKVDASTRSVY